MIAVAMCLMIENHIEFNAEHGFKYFIVSGKDHEALFVGDFVRAEES